MYLAVMEAVYEAADKEPPLCGEHAEEQVETHRAVAMALEEGQQVRNAEENHHMDICEHCKKTITTPVKVGVIGYKTKKGV